MKEKNESLEKVPSTEITSRNIYNAADTKYLADDLAKFIKENKLFSNIQGKEFVSVEGWQYVGTRLGYVPVVESVENRCVDKLFKYQVTVRLMDLRTDKTVGMGVALCSNEEATKKYYQEYAILSMAQTRAVGKAYRNMLAWIIRAAGYMPTPLEEMDEVQSDRGTAVAATPTKVAESRPDPITEGLSAEEKYAKETAENQIPDGLLTNIEGAVTRDELVEIWTGNKKLQTNPIFTAAITKRKNELINVPA